MPIFKVEIRITDNYETEVEAVDEVQAKKKALAKYEDDRCNYSVGDGNAEFCVDEVDAEGNYI